MNKDSVMKTRRLNKIYVQHDKQLQASNVIFLICDTKCLLVAAVLRLSCKEFHIFGPYTVLLHSAYLDMFAVERVSIILSRRLHLSLLARREYL